jgi:hypothetical protein
MRTNHGGVAAIAVPGVQLSLVDLGVNPGTFELLCVRVVSGSSACVAVVVYRPGSEPVSSQFFSDVSDVLDRLVTFVDPIYFVGDVNIRLERTTNSTTIQFTEILAAYGLVSCVTEATHDHGGTLDTVAMRVDLSSSQVTVVDVGLSDHHLLRWSASLARPSPIYTTTTKRPAVRGVSSTSLRSVMLSLRRYSVSPNLGRRLMRMILRSCMTVSLTAILDRLILARTVRCRRRASDPWFDDDCRVAKRSLRLFEIQTCRRQDAVAASTLWRHQRRVYRDLLKSKRQFILEVKAYR